MAGIYVHVPFCQSRCIYCDFYSTTYGEAERASYVRALCREIEAPLPVREEMRCVETVYLGGGTPSQLSSEQLSLVLSMIRRRFDVKPDAELTLEMNPDDVSAERAEFVASHFNRVSLGIQTFDDPMLRWLHRRHDGGAAIRAVKRLQQAGVDNISIDLIYGMPSQTLRQWEHDLDVACSLGVQHLSAYALSVEEGTPLWQMCARGEASEPSEELTVEMYHRLCQRMQASGFEHYEISNFSQPGFRSRHNSGYWSGTPYFGYGPGAHSYDGLRTRWANMRDLLSYLAFWDSCGGAASGLPRTIEQLSDDECYDEFVMCGLRRCEGIDLHQVEERFGAARSDDLQRAAAPHLSCGNLALEGHHLRLTKQSLMISNEVMSDLMA